MGRFKLKIWLLLLGWLWLQPALAQHPLEADLPGHSHTCVLCALHLDGKLALTPNLPIPVPHVVIGKLADIALPTTDSTPSGQCRIRAPPHFHCFSH
ncbi:TPA: hypothetical protein SIA26_003873 [Aeromonas bestiarum]|nr:hypothetical protein [Aeromonas bestiarum]